MGRKTMTEKALAANRANAKKGAGRPPGSLSEETKMRIAARRLFLQKMEAQFGPLIDTQIELAFGEFVMVEKVGEDGKKTVTKVYRKTASGDTGRYLIDQMIGKPKDAIDLTLLGKDGEPVDPDALIAARMKSYEPKPASVPAPKVRRLAGGLKPSRKS